MQVHDRESSCDQKDGNWKEAIPTLEQIDSCNPKCSSVGRESSRPASNTYRGIVIARKWIRRSGQKRKGADQKRIRPFRYQEDQEKAIVMTETDELKKDLARLTSVGRDLQEAGQSLSDDDLREFNNTRDIAKRKRNSRILIGVASMTNYRRKPYLLLDFNENVMG